MKTKWSAQYGCSCVVPAFGDTADDVIAACCKEQAICRLEGEEDYVVELRSDVGPEVYSESALRRSLPLDPAERAAATHDAAESAAARADAADVAAGAEASKLRGGL